MKSEKKYVLSAFTTESQSEIYHALRAPRRRLTILLLRHELDAVGCGDREIGVAVADVSSSRSGISVRELAREIVMIEQNVTREHATGDAYHSVYTSLIQTHLPKLDDISAIKYDGDRKTVKPGCNLTALTAVVLTTSPISQLLFFDPVVGDLGGCTHKISDASDD